MKQDAERVLQLKAKCFIRDTNRLVASTGMNALRFLVMPAILKDAPEHAAWLTREIYRLNDFSPLEVVEDYCTQHMEDTNAVV